MNFSDYRQQGFIFHPNYMSNVGVWLGLAGAGVVVWLGTLSSL